MILDMISYVCGKIKGEKKVDEYMKLIAKEEFEVSTSSTSAALIDNMTITENIGKDDILFVHIRDKAGKRSEYFYGSDCIITNYMLANDNDGKNTSKGTYAYGVNSSDTYTSANSAYGVFVTGWTPSDGTLAISSRYNSSYGTIDGTYVVEVYKLNLGVVMFD